MIATSQLLALALPTLDLNAWYTPSIIAGLALFTGVAVHAFYRCTDWKGGLAAAMSGD